MPASASELGFRVEAEEAAEAQRWSTRLGVDRSALLREALHRHLLRLASETFGTSESLLALAGNPRLAPALTALFNQPGYWLCHTSVCPRTDFPFCRA